MMNLDCDSSGSLDPFPFLSPKVASQILGYLANENIVLVGGQAVMFWARHYGLIEETASLTRDIDFFGQRADIEDADLRLSNFNHETRYAQWDDSSPNAGLILIEVPGLKNRLVVDFLWAVQGLSGSELREKAVSTKMPGIDRPLLVLHPFMCMESKISNLGALPGKRSDEGIEQARLSVQIMKAYLGTLLSESRERDALKMLERVARIASSDASNYAFLACGVDVMQAIEVDRFSSGDLKLKRYPQIEAHISDRRARFMRLLPENPTPDNTQRMRF
jgi:hypothetical protein